MELLTGCTIRFGKEKFQIIKLLELYFTLLKPAKFILIIILFLNHEGLEILDIRRI
jgi:hypothetical protein